MNFAHKRVPFSRKATKRKLHLGDATSKGTRPHSCPCSLSNNSMAASPLFVFHRYEQAFSLTGRMGEAPMNQSQKCSMLALNAPIEVSVVVVKNYISFRIPSNTYAVTPPPRFKTANVSRPRIKLYPLVCHDILYIYILCYFINVH